MFNTCLHFTIFAYQFNLGPCIINRPSTVNAVLGCPLLNFILFMPDNIFVKKIMLRNSYNFKTNTKETIFFLCNKFIFSTFVYYIVNVSRAYR